MPPRRLSQRSRHSLPSDPRRGHQPLLELVDVGQRCACKSKPQAFFCNSLIVNESELCTVQISKFGFISNGESDCHLGLPHFP
ncbi:hypothetical protein TB1_029665 [Malus domestica]